MTLGSERLNALQRGLYEYTLTELYDSLKKIEQLEIQIHSLDEHISTLREENDKLIKSVAEPKGGCFPCATANGWYYSLQNYSVEISQTGIIHIRKRELR